MATPERSSSPRGAWAARRQQASAALATMRSRTRQELRSMALGLRRGAACLAFSSAWVGSWLLGVWSLGSSFVYAEGAYGVGEGAEPPATLAQGADGTRPASPDRAGAPPASSEIERVACVDGDPIAPRVARPYPLDDRPRAATSGQLACPSVELTDHAGDGIAFDPPARVTPPFRERLRELERVLREVSLPFYGRAPSALLVASSYDCRAINGRSERLSEHALGNAIDITGFRFDALDAASAPAFEVRVDRHWQASGDATRELHARFLQALTRALIARDVFRTLLGPAHRDHADHFHFDMAPHYYVDL